MSAVAKLIPAAPRGKAPIRVMVVDDAVVARSLVGRWVEQESELELVAAYSGGRAAIDALDRADPDVIVLDVDMPDLDGIETLRLLLRQKRDLVVIMISTLSRRSAEVSMKALSLGAADFLCKPHGRGELATSAVFRHGLIERILLLGARRRDAARPRAGESLPPLPAIGRRTRHQPGAEIALRPFANAAPRVLVIGASTGGPQALTRLLGDLGETIDRAPVLITQHMPPTFTTILAEHLARASGRPVREAEDGEPVRAGRVYLAPGGRHMRVRRQDGTAVMALDDGPPINFCKPAVDPLFASAAATWKSWVLGLVLTGMGSDGTFGAGEIVNAGGNMIVQDEASSAIWGMPGAVAQSGLASAMLPLDQIAAKVERLFLGDRP